MATKRARESQNPDIGRFAVPNANLYLRLAREAARSGDLERALLGYSRSLETWRRANWVTGGRWKAEEEVTDREYTSFLLGRVPEAETPPRWKPVLVPGERT